jgi:hypothetical protein
MKTSLMEQVNGRKLMAFLQDNLKLGNLSRALSNIKMGPFL